MANATNRLIWWALLSAIVVYGVVSFTVAPSLDVAVDTDVRLVAVALGVVSLSTAVATIFIRGRMLVGPIQRGDLDPRRPEDMQRAFVGFLLCMVLTESIGIYGLVVALLSGNGIGSVPFLAVAFGLMLVHRPTAGDLRPPAGGAHGYLDSAPIA